MDHRHTYINISSLINKFIIRNQVNILVEKIGIFCNKYMFEEQWSMNESESYTSASSMNQLHA